MRQSVICIMDKNFTTFEEFKAYCIVTAKEWAEKREEQRQKKIKLFFLFLKESSTPIPEILYQYADIEFVNRISDASLFSYENYLFSEEKPEDREVFYFLKDVSYVKFRLPSGFYELKYEFHGSSFVVTDTVTRYTKVFTKLEEAISYIYA